MNTTSKSPRTHTPTKPADTLDIYLFRHGETDFNRYGFLQGQQGVPLNDKGKEQAHAIALTAQTFGIEEIIASPLSRAYNTGLILKMELENLTGKPVGFSVNDGLMEIDLGPYEGKSKSYVDELFGKNSFARWASLATADDTCDFCKGTTFNDGETKAELRKRARGTMDDIASHSQHNTIGIAGHGTYFGNFLATLGIRDIYPANGEVVHMQYNRASHTWHFKELIANPKANNLRMNNFTEAATMENQVMQNLLSHKR